MHKDHSEPSKVRVWHYMYGEWAWELHSDPFTGVGNAGISFRY